MYLPGMRSEDRTGSWARGKHKLSDTYIIAVSGPLGEEAVLAGGRGKLSHPLKEGF